MPFIEDYQAVIALALLVAMFAGFCSERWSPEVVALAGASTFLALGILPTETALSVLSNSAPAAIAALFIVSAALLRTGVVSAASRMVLKRAGGRPALAVATVLICAAAASAFMNNTPLVMVMIPVVLQIARTTSTPSSRLLIPLSYAAILGGTCTLIGTSTNILVDGVSRRLGMEPFGLFEIAPLGLAAVAAGAAFMVLAAPRLLPGRMTLADILASKETPRFVTELSVPRGSGLVNRKVGNIAPLAGGNVLVLALWRRGRALRSPLMDKPLKTYDRIIVAAPSEELLALYEQPGLKVGRSPNTSPSEGTQVVEALVAPGRTLAGRRLGELRLHARYGVYPLAVHRYGRLAGTDLDAIRLRAGDTILLEGAPDAINALARDTDLLNLSAPQMGALRRHKAPIALAAMALVIVLATFEVMPIAGLAIIAAALVLVTGCLEAREAWASIDGRLLVLILAMLAVGRGIEDSGALKMIVDAVTPLLQQAPPLLVLALVYALTSILTEMVTNNAVAVVVTPLAVGVAAALGLDPRPFVVAVMFGASASFATPIGYQTNTMVYSIGGYQFTDFLRIGVPMNIIIGAVSVFLIPMIWPLDAP